MQFCPPPPHHHIIVTIIHKPELFSRVQLTINNTPIFKQSSDPQRGLLKSNLVVLHMPSFLLRFHGGNSMLKAVVSGSCITSLTTPFNLTFTSCHDKSN